MTPAEKLRQAADTIEDIFPRQARAIRKVADELDLRDAGCTCSPPLLGERPGVGPRCRLCNVVAEEQPASLRVMQALEGRT